MSKANTAAQALGNEGAPGFDWGKYEDWNGSTLKRNKKVRTKKSDAGVTVLSHERYASSTFRKYLDGVQAVSKEIVSGDVLDITDIIPMADGNSVMATVKNGANNIIIDLEKESKFLNNLTLGNEVMDKDTFIKCLRNQQIKENILNMKLAAKVGTDTAKASIWDGFVTNLNKEMHEQIALGNRAYLAHVTAVNNGGLIVEISNAVKAFLPASLISTSHLQSVDFSEYLGKKLEVMVEDFRPGRGFIVSRKKYIQAILPGKLAKLAEELADVPDKLFTGKIIGVTKYGVFVQLDEYVTGMLHKSLVGDIIREAMRDGSLEIGTMIDVYIHRIEENRVILSDVPLDERDAVIARREAEDEAEKAAYAEELARQEAEAEERLKAEEDLAIEKLADSFGTLNQVHVEIDA